VAAEAFDVGSARTEDRDRAFCAPGGVLAQVEAVGHERQSAVAGQEPGQGEFLGGGEQLLLPIELMRVQV
jgi:hypothetical protein